LGLLCFSSEIGGRREIRGKIVPVLRSRDYHESLVFEEEPVELQLNVGLLQLPDEEVPLVFY
jgi:hypothetical protein